MTTLAQGSDLLGQSASAVWPVVPEVCVAVSACLILLIDVYGGHKRRGLSATLTMIALLVGVLLTSRFGMVLQRELLFNSMYVADGLGTFLKLVAFVTMATAFALPESFPQRDTVVLTAFCVVLATLVLQGLTLRPLVTLLKLGRNDEAARELASARAAMAKAALVSIAGEDGPEAENLRYRFTLKERTCRQETSGESITRLRELSLKAVEAEREKLEDLRLNDRIGADAYLGLQEQLDWSELTVLRDADQKIEEI